MSLSASPRGSTRRSVLLVDDSAVGRAVLRGLIDASTTLRVVAEACNGREAVLMCARLRPHLVIMDVLMPVLSGVDATRAMMALGPQRVVLFSDLATRDARQGFEALQAGALDLIRRPTGAQMRDEAERRRLLRRFELLADLPVASRFSSEAKHAGTDAATRASGGLSARGSVAALPTAVRSAPDAGVARLPTAVSPRYRLACIGASTGGPPALAVLLGTWAPAPPWPVLIVQHMTPGFLPGLAAWLSQESGCHVEVASDGQAVAAGRVYLAPDRAHLELVGGTLRAVRTDPVGGHVPSVDVLLQSVARTQQGATTMAVLLTGMGADGAEGMVAIRQAGGFCVAQDEHTSIVFGMPKAAIDRGAACEVLPLERIGARLLSAS